MIRAVCRPYCLAFSMLLLLTQAMTAQWSEVKLPRPNPQTSLVAVEWPDSSTGYVFDARGVYYKTTDEGVTWSVDSLRPPAGFTLRYADFITPKFGIASFEHRNRPGTDTLLFVTSDGGLTWKTVLVTLRNAGFWGSSNSGYSQIRMQSPDRWFRHYAMLDYDRPAPAEMIHFSNDQGASWQEIGKDSLAGEASAMCYVIMDSSDQYKFYTDMWGDQLFCSVRASTDGGKTWRVMDDFANPLGGRYYSGGFSKIHMVNDTGLAVITYPWSSSFPPTRIDGYALVTKDIRYHNTPDGWELFTVPWFGSATTDITYRDGILYTLTDSPGQIGYYDSLWIRNVHQSSTNRGFLSPARINGLTTSSRDVLWGLQLPGSWYNKLYRFDRRLVSVEETKPRPAGEGMRVHPNPMHGNSEMMLTYELADHVVEATIGIYDILGRRISSISLGERNRGSHQESINLASSAITTTRGLHVVVLSTPYRVLSSTTVMFY